MDGYATYEHKHAKNNYFPIDFAIFTKALPMDQPTDGPTDGHTLFDFERCENASKKRKQGREKKKEVTDQPTDQRTDGHTLL